MRIYQLLRPVVHRKTFLSLLIVLLLGVSACSYIGIGQGEVDVSLGIVTPSQGAIILAGSPLQIQSTYPQDDISRVELWVQQDGAEAKLIRSDVPADNVVVQNWTPPTVGNYRVEAKAFTANNQPVNSDALVRTIQVVDSEAVSLVEAAPAVEEAPAPAGADSAALMPPEQAEVAATPTPRVVIQVVEQENLAPPPTPIRRYPPPPPAPGVPPGPIQAELPQMTPPTCDAAEFVSVFGGDTSRRVNITEDDDIPAKVVGGTTVFRGWRLRNTGTCTWGPGYELSFYGGRAMGSGGVAFENTFPADPSRRNAIVDSGRLVVPEGKPNQVAVMELALVAPVTPGIHQSYWRMRNPQGVYFGPILGTSMEVVRECQANIYGAPFINRFEILGVGNVFRPVDPITVVAQQDEAIILDWNIINATNFDIVFEEPTGRTNRSVTTDSQSGRETFVPSTLGQHVIRLFADNGPCTVEATVNVDVIPDQESGFNFIVVLPGSAASLSANTEVQYSAAVAPGTTRFEWNHSDPAVDDIAIIAEVFERQPPAADCAWYDYFNDRCQERWRFSGSQTIDIGGTSNSASATVSNVPQLCSTPDTQIRFHALATENGAPAAPYRSNIATIRCFDLGPRSLLPTELDGSGMGATTTGGVLGVPFEPQ